jgi:predicted metal-dependent hydrolase
VRVTIPRGGSQREAEAFAARQRAWITRQLVQLESHQPRFSAEERAAFEKRASSELPLQLYSLAARLGLHVSRVSIRNQRARWGSCGRDGHIALNWRLITMPDWVREYVLIHELIHLRRADHSPKYWALVAQACPHHVEARAWLRAHGPALL